MHRQAPPGSFIGSGGEAFSREQPGWLGERASKPIRSPPFPLEQAEDQAMAVALTAVAANAITQTNRIIFSRYRSKSTALFR
jgi:hypothetical protein